MKNNNDINNDINDKSHRTLNTNDFLKELEYRVNNHEDIKRRIYLYEFKVIYETIIDIFKDVIVGGLTLKLRGLGRLYIRTFNTYYDPEMPNYNVPKFKLSKKNFKTKAVEKNGE